MRTTCNCTAALRANKPKALSARFTVELGTKTRREDDAVLVSAKTMPCPNKSGPFLACDEQFWIPLRKSEAKRLLLT